MTDITRHQLELLAISLYQMDRGTMRQWSGIELAERVRYRTMATDLLMEESYAAPKVTVEAVGQDLVIKDNGFEGVLATRKKRSPKIEIIEADRPD